MPGAKEARGRFKTEAALEAVCPLLKPHTKEAFENANSHPFPGGCFFI
jgi:hypothetical protein